MADTANAPQRYSDKRLNDSFTAYVLLSEAIQFLPEEIFAAVAEDYPGLEWNLGLSVAPPFDSSKISIATYFGGNGPSALHGLISMISSPGPIGIPMEEMIAKSRFVFPEARQAIATHSSCLSISVSSTDTSLPARFEAAKRMNCLTAVFAKLPTCKAIYFPSADVILPPHSWLDGANTAMKGEFPAFQWINYIISPYGEIPPPGGQHTFTVSTIGCAAFNGHEICLPAVQMDRTEALKLVYAAIMMLLQYGNEFKDSDTMGDDPKTMKVRIRHWAEGVRGAQTDIWTLFHPSSVLDDIALFGARTGKPPPPGFDNSTSGQEGWLRQRLRLFGGARAGRPN
jgi:hypothetical protein